MKHFILSLGILLAPAFGWAQMEYNQAKRLSKKEFMKLMLERDKFIPSNLKSGKVLIVKCAVASHKKLRRAALIASLLRNNYDTTSMATNSYFNEQWQRDWYDEKMSNSLAVSEERELSKKGIKSQITMEDEESSYSIEDFPYLLKMDVVSTMSDPYKAWMTKMTFYFVDRRTNKSFGVLLPTNHDVWDLFD